MAKAVGMPRTEAAQQAGGIVVSNDRFRDWVDQFPDIVGTQRLRRGGYKAGAYRVNLPTSAN